MSYRYEDGFDGTEWGRGYHEEPEEDWRGRGYAEPEEEWRGQGYDHGYNHGYDRGYDRGYENGHDHDQGYDQGYNQGYNQGYGYREEEEDDRGRSAGYQYGDPEDEPRAVADESLFRWLAVSYASTHLSMVQNLHGSCQGGTPAGGHGIVNRAKWKPITGSK